MQQAGWRDGKNPIFIRHGSRRIAPTRVERAQTLPGVVSFP
jgi:hypothetical protein